MSRLPRVAAAFAGLVLLVGGITVMNPLGRPARADDVPAGPRAGRWSAVQRALDEGKPKTALEALGGLEAAALEAGAWDEVARAVATRVVAETGDRPADDPERLVRLEAALETAPERTRPVLGAILANWTWGFFQANRWRFAGRTAGAGGGTDEKGAPTTGLAGIASWDLPRVVAEIRRRFAAALEPAERLQSLPVSAWDAVLEPGTLPDAWRPTVWDVVVRDALDFAASGERGLVDPEDGFEFDVDAPALGTRQEFLAWSPETDPAVTDADSPLLLAVRLWRSWLRFHAADADRAALLSADLARIEWARGAAVSPGGDAERDARAKRALRALLEDCADHPVGAMVRHDLARLLRGGSTEDAVVEARAIAAAGAAAHPDSPGGRLCRNLVAEIDARELELFTERVWAPPWPALRVRARNLARVHVRVVKADWDARLRAGKAQWQWLDDGDRARLLGADPERSFAIDIPARADLRHATHDVTVPRDLAPGPWWIIASADDDFTPDDNVVSATLVWVTRLALVTRQGGFPGAGDALEGHVVDGTTGLPVAGARVVAFVRGNGGDPQPFAAGPETVTDADGHYRLAGEPQRETVLEASATIDGVRHAIVSDPFATWNQPREERHERFVLLSDRGIHRPGQFVRYKGILARADTSAGDYRALAARRVSVALRDANGREVARQEARTGVNGSFHGEFAIPPGALPGPWTIMAEGEGIAGLLGVRVEEYKRPKFRVEFAPPAAVVLDRELTLSGTATTYTGLPVANAGVRWHVERLTRFPPWCRFVFPWIPLDGAAARIARGTATTGPDGTFTIAFPARPDRSVPVDSLPVFSYRIVADVTDPSGETRSAEKVVNAGYTALRATVSADAWQAPAAPGEMAEVAVTVATESLDGEPRAAAGTLTIRRLVQPEAPRRPDLLPVFDEPAPGPAAGVPRRGAARRPAPAVPPRPVDGDEAEGFEAGEAVFTARDTTDAATGKAVARVRLAPGIYRAEFVVDGDGPAVKGRGTIEVLDPAATEYPVRRSLALSAPAAKGVPGGEFEAILGTGHAGGRCFVEVLRDGKTLSGGWTDAGRTQWPVKVPVTEDLRGGFTIRAWIVHDGRLWQTERVVDVPWSDRRLEVTWERFTRRVEPGAQVVWRARVRSVDDPLAGPARGMPAEVVATLYDRSLDALAPHPWPDGLAALLRRESSPAFYAIGNRSESFQPILGTWRQETVGVEIGYRRFRPPFAPLAPQFFGFGGRSLLRGTVPAAMPLMAADGVPAPGAPGRIMTKALGLPDGAELAEGAALGDGAAPPPAGAAPPVPAETAPPPRKNLVETAFFFPALESGPDGDLVLEFTLPETLATWQFKAFAHDDRLRSGTLLDTAIAAKDLMVEPVLPRFLREGDVVAIPVKIGNRSTGRLEGAVRLELADARTGASRQGLLDTPAAVPFDLAAGESQAVTFRVRVADGTETLRWTAIGSAGRASDGEEALLPVLPRRVPVDESVPITLRGPGSRTAVLERLADAAAHPSIASRTLVVQATSNPAWYAVQALPSIAEQADESVETLFTRLFANAWAGHLARSDVRIERTFAQWRDAAAGRDPLASPLETNTPLLQTLLAETPWVREAGDETAARRRIGLLFDANRADGERRSALARLESLRNADGGWPWFPGGRTCDPVSLAIVADIGRLRAAGVDIDAQPALATLPWLDGRLVAWRRQALDRGEAPLVDPLVAMALHARSFFAADVPLQGDAAAAHAFWLDAARRTWPKASRRAQGWLAIALFRAGDRATAGGIVDSLRQRAVGADVAPGEEGEDWQGMWWRDPHPTWWQWSDAPIETQALLIEAFDEVAGDRDAVESMKAWLLSQKRTSRWRGDRATAAAVGALLGRGADLLAPSAAVSVAIGGQPLPADRTGAPPEAGTGFVEARWTGEEIVPGLARVTLAREDRGLAWGGIHWQYLDDIANVPAVGRAELAVDKKLFVKRRTKAGPELVPVSGDGGTRVALGDELVVRLVVTADRDHEFLELSDHRPSVTEPVDVLSGWRYGDGAAWYLAIRDASTRLFFERLPRGTHVFEYSLRAAHRGSAASGFATLRSRYAPEFSARSASVAVEVE